MLVWAIARANRAQNAIDCARESTAEPRRLCEGATDVGTGIGVAMIFGLWFLASDEYLLTQIRSGCRRESAALIEAVQERVEVLAGEGPVEGWALVANSC
jgi:hypothetical protein